MTRILSAKTLRSIFLLILILMSCIVEAQVRYKDKVFTGTTIARDILFGQSKTIYGDTLKLYMDIFQPAGDLVTGRPCVVWVHGGGFKSGNRYEMESFCQEFALRGYVAATIEYRLGLTAPGYATQFREELLRAVQDAKAAVRYLRMKANDLRIDTSSIFMGGSSAGSFVALHCGYWDQNELPVDINQTLWGDLEGTSGNPGYSSAIRGIINYCGAMADTTCMNSGEPPVGCFQGANDNIVPVNIGVYYDARIEMYGSAAIGRVATRLGIYNQVAIIPGMYHGVGEDAGLYAQLISFSANFLYSLLTPAGVRDETVPPNHFILEQNYPNPFNPSTKIGFRVSGPGLVSLNVYDVLGREVRTLVDKELKAGAYETIFDATGLPSGIYFYRLQSGTLAQTKKLLLLR